jgi:hypothetical protein
MTSIRSDGWPITPHGLSVLCQYKSGWFGWNCSLSENIAVKIRLLGMLKNIGTIYL